MKDIVITPHFLASANEEFYQLEKEYFETEDHYDDDDSHNVLFADLHNIAKFAESLVNTPRFHVHYFMKDEEVDTLYFDHGISVGDYLLHEILTTSEFFNHLHYLDTEFSEWAIDNSISVNDIEDFLKYRSFYTYCVHMFRVAYFCDRGTLEKEAEQLREIIKKGTVASG